MEGCHRPYDPIFGIRPFLLLSRGPTWIANFQQVFFSSNMYFQQLGRYEEIVIIGLITLYGPTGKLWGFHVQPGQWTRMLDVGGSRCDLTIPRIKCFQVKKIIDYRLSFASPFPSEYPSFSRTSVFDQHMIYKQNLVDGAKRRCVTENLRYDIR